LKHQMVFCPECRKEVNFSVRDQLESAELKGESYEYYAKSAYCEYCGSELYISEFEDGNLKSLYDLYRQRNDIISLEEIREIPEKYHIGKRPLSLLLGWGEQTFSRYYEGDMPTKQYSEILKQICSNPAYYLSLLENGKHHLKSDKAYQKSKLTTEKKLRIPFIQQSKIDHVVEYLISQCHDITPLSLQKALYYVQGFYYAFYGKFLFKEDCEAWVHGPVYKSIYKRFSEHYYNPILSREISDISAMPTGEMVLLDSIVKHLCCYSGKTLESFTHLETPWTATRGDLHPAQSTNRIIPKQVIGDFFASVKDKYCMLTPADIKNYSQDMFFKTY